MSTTFTKPFSRTPLIAARLCIVLGSLKDPCSVQIMDPPQPFHSSHSPLNNGLSWISKLWAGAGLLRHKTMALLKNSRSCVFNQDHVVAKRSKPQKDQANVYDNSSVRLPYNFKGCTRYERDFIPSFACFQLEKKEMVCLSERNSMDSGKSFGIPRWLASILLSNKFLYQFIILIILICQQGSSIRIL